MTKEEVAEKAAQRILDEATALPGEHNQITAIITQAITDYIRSTPPAGPLSKEKISDMRKTVIELRAFAEITASDIDAYIEHLERTVVMLMDEGEVYNQGRLAAKAEWEDERKELVELLKKLECIDSTVTTWRSCPICRRHRSRYHTLDCRLALAIGAERREE